MVKVGDTAILKVSNEEVFVLEIIPQMVPANMEIKGTVSPLGNQVTVRRPIMGQDGVKHLIETFFMTELETRDERMTRELAERDMLRKKMGLGDEAEAMTGQVN
jgi:hypothetical protein